MNPPPPPPAPPPTTTNLFSNPDGSRMRVFTQAEDVLGRPKILRSLKTNGAELCSDISVAQFILVDPQTETGRQFIRNWGTDPSKTILGVSWVRESLARGHPLLEDDGWGGCATQDDGFPVIEGDSDSEELTKSPLPTPRVTPDERPRSPSKSKTKALKQRKPVSTPGTDHQMYATSPSTSNSSMSVPPGPSVPLPPQTNLAINTQAQNPLNPLLLMQNPAIMAQFMNPLQGAIMGMPPDALNTMLMSNFQMSLADALRQYANAGPPTSLGVTHGNTPNMPMSTPPVPFPSSLTQPSAGEVFPGPTYMSTDYSEPQSISHQSRSAGIGPSSKQKGKMKDPSSSVKRSRISSSSGHELVHKSQTSDTSALPLNSSQPKPFMSQSGKAYCFLIQIGIHNRTTLAMSIKKGGGRIVNNMNDADFAVLSNTANQHKDFQGLLLEAHAVKRRAVSTKFIQACLDQNKLVDPSPYLYEPTLASKQKRKRSVSIGTEISDSGANHASHKVAEMKDKNQQKRRKSQNETRADGQGTSSKTSAEQERKKNKTPTPKKKVKKVVIAPVGPRSPSPPPEHTKESWGNGYKFSAAENEYARNYAKVLLERDHQTSKSAIASALHKKLPHHSTASWATHLGNIIPELDQWRKRAGIAFRKAQSQKETSGSTGTHALSQNQTPDIEMSDDQDSETNEDAEHDINAVVSFFAQGNDQNQEEPESAVWSRLAEQATCRTAHSWQEFYEQNHEEVIKRYLEIVPSAAT